jgi:hypothetical protein
LELKNPSSKKLDASPSQRSYHREYPLDRSQGPASIHNPSSISNEVTLNNQVSRKSEPLQTQLVDIITHTYPDFPEDSPDQLAFLFARAKNADHLHDEIDELKDQLQIAALHERDATLKAQRQVEMSSIAADSRISELNRENQRMQHELNELRRTQDTTFGGVSFRGKKEELQIQKEIEEMNTELSRQKIISRELEAKLKVQEEYLSREKENSQKYKLELDSLRH